MRRHASVAVQAMMSHAEPAWVRDVGSGMWTPMIREQQAGSPSRRTDHGGSGIGRRCTGVLCVLFVASVLLSGCASSSQVNPRVAAQQNKAKLDAELRKAVTTAGIPQVV